MTPSLLVTKGAEGKARIKCFGGCEEEVIVASLLEKYPNFKQTLLDEKRGVCSVRFIPPSEFLSKLKGFIEEIPLNGRKAVSISLFSPEGKIYRLFRLKLDGANKVKLEKFAPARELLFCTPDNFVENNEVIFVVESPVDAIYLYGLDFRALAGVGKTKYFLSFGKVESRGEAVFA